ncbi:MAG: hypothetical protein HY317_05645 [Acidobacteria bacterium]|nr:hypothetical protein [Acidobacteriota bacterium]
MAEPRAANPLVDEFRKGGVPKELRVMAAQGALPLKPEDLVDLLHHLLGDPDESIRQAAEGSLMAFPVDEMLPILRDRATPPAVLSWGLAHRVERELREVALQNTSTPDEAVEATAPSLPEALAELVVINQVRLLRRTSLLEAIESNPELNNDQRRRLRELRETFRIGEEAEPAAAVPQAPPAPAEAAPEEAPAEETFEELPLSEEEAVVRYLSEEERQQTEKVGAVQKLYRLNTAEKVITALKGTREERAILVRDPNRIVATAVLGSPRITEAEIESFASMKNVSDAILRQIGTNRDWTKRYGVVASLVKNPRTPLAISLGMVPRLNPRDIKSIAVDRNVPEAIRKQAQRFIRAAQSGPGERNKH